MKRTLSFCTVLSVAFVTSSVHASPIFPDVQDGHVFQESIESLVHSQVISGNPDGTFRPDDNVNRAAMLKMLYRAKGKVPDPLSIRCFPDVVIGSWYESFVCDAALRGYVAGYSDGTFRPDNPVNKVEALKMVNEVFEIPVNEITDADRDLVKFVDVSTSAWYTKYMYTAYARGVLPIPGEQSSRFEPDRSLTRGEAAAIIYNALSVDLTETHNRVVSSSSSAQTEDEDEDETETEDEGSTQSTQSSAAANVSSEDEEGADSFDVSLPFDRDGKFTRKKSKSYLFNVTSNTVIDVDATLQSGQPGGLSCRLYLVNESGFSDQYFLGYEHGNTCTIRAAVSPGSYQLQLQPTVSDTTYSVQAETGAGDGNDGFREAFRLNVNSPRTEVLTAVDIEDFYTFSVITNQRMTVELSNATELRCIVYAMNDVNLESFSGPECNKVYNFPSGTYYVAVARKAPKGAQQTYTIRLDK